MLIPFHLGAWLHKELHLHLLKLSHSKDELASHDLISECFTDLGNSKRYLLTGRLLYIKKIDKYPLCCLWSQIQLAFFASDITQLRVKHQIELSHVCPVAAATLWAGNLKILDELLQACHVLILHMSAKQPHHSVNLSLTIYDALISCSKLCLIKIIAKAFLSFDHIFLDLVLDLFAVSLDELIGTISFLAILIINQWVIKCINMSSCLLYTSPSPRDRG